MTGSESLDCFYCFSCLPWISVLNVCPDFDRLKFKAGSVWDGRLFQSFSPPLFRSLYCCLHQLSCWSKTPLYRRSSQDSAALLIYAFSVTQHLTASHFTYKHNHHLLAGEKSLCSRCLFLCISIVASKNAPKTSVLKCAGATLILRQQRHLYKATFSFLCLFSQLLNLHLPVSGSALWFWWLLGAQNPTECPIPPRAETLDSSMSFSRVKNLFSGCYWNESSAQVY